MSAEKKYVGGIVMSQVKLTMNVLLSLIIHSKKRGSGVVGNGRLLVKLLQIFADNSIKDKNVLACFNDEIEKSKSYHKVDKFIGRFLPQGRYYPYDKIKFSKFESLIGIKDRMAEYLRITAKFCDEIFDESKIDSFVFTLLEILRHDESIDKILYGKDFIPKSDLFGTVAHPKRICIEALLLGCLYHVHKYPDESEEISIFEPSEKITFKTVRYDTLNSLETDCPINILDNIKDIASRQRSAEMKYRVEIKEQNGSESDSNIILFGSGGMGKTTYLLSLISDKSYINFYLPLYDFKPEYHENYCESSMWILMNILLKYRYQYEYQTYDSACAGEGEIEILRQLSELENDMKSRNICVNKKYRLLLDGINEISHDLQRKFYYELEEICGKWKNVQIITTSRTIPNYDLFKNLSHQKICGIVEEDIKNTLGNESDIVQNEEMLELLRTPLFFNIYLDNRDSANSLNNSGEILNAYIMNFKGDSATRFIVQFVLPLVSINSSSSVTRGQIAKEIEYAIEIYIKNQYVYQNYVAPRNIDKNEIFESRLKNDWIEMIVKNIGLMEAYPSDPRELRFVHQYFRDYFHAKQIINGIELLISIENLVDKSTFYDIAWNFKISGIWFVDDLNPMQLLGEICGDYKNKDYNGYGYNYTILDDFLDLCRSKEPICAFENVVRTMCISRNGRICRVDFSRLMIPNLYSFCRFDDNGQFPCDFSKCTICGVPYFIPINDGIPDKNYYEYDVNGDNMAIFFKDYSDLIVWNTKEKRVLCDINLWDYINSDEYFTEMSFTENGEYLQILSFSTFFTIDILNGKIISKIEPDDEEYYDLSEKFKSQRQINEDLSCETLDIAISLVDRYRNCDFRNAKYMVEDSKKTLELMGGIVGDTPPMFNFDS